MDYLLTMIDLQRTCKGRYSRFCVGVLMAMYGQALEGDCNLWCHPGKLRAITTYLVREKRMENPKSWVVVG